jgi:hypothetical protein
LVVIGHASHLTIKRSSRDQPCYSSRFRISAYTSNNAGAVTRVREISAADARIEWEIPAAKRDMLKANRDVTLP